MSDAKPPTFQDLMASIGNILMYWGMLEVLLQQKTGRPNSERDARPSASANLKAWVDLHRASPSLTAAQADLLTSIEKDVEAARSIRNLVAHGIIGAQAIPYSSDEAHLICQDARGGSRHLAYSELWEAVQTIDRCRRRIDFFPRLIS